jgi:dihydroorotate dehydrogenase
MFRYQPDQNYDWNYEHAPPPEAFPEGAERESPVSGRAWDFCGLPVSSPLGMPAGPLLNGRWVVWYARLGFDVLTYKTVRSRARACYPLPNLLPVDPSALPEGPDEICTADQMRGSWAISFGMPSRAPEVWRRDVEWTRSALPPGKVLSVSVVGTMQPGWGLGELAADYATCARWAVDAGAHCVEANLSCPNVSSADGQLYQQPAAAACVAQAVRAAVGNAPVLLKIGHVTDPAQAEALARAVAPWADALVMVNCLARRVRSGVGELWFSGEPRGIGGDGIRDAAVAQVRLFRRVIQEADLPLRLVGVGGVGNAAEVCESLDAGAHAVHLATAAMIEPEVGLRIRREWPGRE